MITNRHGGNYQAYRNLDMCTNRKIPPNLPLQREESIHQNSCYLNSVAYRYLLSPLKKGDLGGFFLNAQVPSTTKSPSARPTKQSYRRRTKTVEPPKRKTSPRHTILPAETDRQLHCRFLCTDDATRDRSGWRASFYSATSGLRSAAQRIF